MTEYATIDLVETPLEDTRLHQFPALLDVSGFRHAVTSRPWNMATHCGPEPQCAVMRRRRVCEAIGLPFERLVAPDQVHSPHVVVVTESDAGRGRDGRHTALRFVDGVVCGTARLPVMQFSADCPLVVVVEAQRQLFGMAHASWRGTVAGITVELVRQMREAFGVDPSALTAAICPCAGPAQYEVGEEVRRVAVARLGADAEPFFQVAPGRIFFDMRGANVRQLVASGVSMNRISVAAASTMASDEFYSYRRDGAMAGRFALVAGFA